MPLVGARRAARQRPVRSRPARPPAQHRDIFGPDNYFIEVQDHGLGDQRRIIGEQVRIARELGVPVVATNDLHYTRKEDAKPHDVLLCIQQQKLQSDPKRLRFDSEEFYLKTAEEMRRVFAELPDACDQTLAIAERVQLLPELERILVEHRTEYRLPRFETPHGEALEAYLRELVERGAAERYGTPVPAEVLARVDTELAVITKMGFAGYFLIVWDLIRFARDQGIRVGPGPRLGGGLGRVVRAADHRPRSVAVRLAVRAVPQPRSGRDARHRHGLRRAPAR